MHYDLICIGGGSGGIATAKRAATHGKRCAVIEAHHLGGTCVNVGCVPKKVMWYASHIAETLHFASDYGFDIDHASFAWDTLVNNRQNYIQRLRQIYSKGLQNNAIDHIQGLASFIDEKTIAVDNDHYTADHIVVATGGKSVIPDIPGAKLMVGAFVGTTLAAPTFVVRPLLMKGKGWTIDNIKEQRRDALTGAIFMFIISASIMVCATGALYHRGMVITKVLDMVYTLEPVAGKFAVALFLIGTLSAGLSSTFPIMMVAPLLIGDYRAGELDTKSGLFRILSGIACLTALTVPILGANPIMAQIATQVSGVFVLPLVIGSIFIVLNRKKDMGEHKAGILLNLGLITAFIFSCVISYTSINALREFFS